MPYINWLVIPAVAAELNVNGLDAPEIVTLFGKPAEAEYTNIPAATVPDVVLTTVSDVEALLTVPLNTAAAPTITVAVAAEDVTFATEI